MQASDMIGRCSEILKRRDAGHQAFAEMIVLFRTGLKMRYGGLFVSCQELAICAGMLRHKTVVENI